MWGWVVHQPPLSSPRPLPWWKAQRQVMEIATDQEFSLNG